MKSFYTYWCYRDLIKDSIQQKKSLNPSFTAQGLAEAIGIQKSYLSKVLNKRSHLSADQLYLLAQELNWNANEQSYVSLLQELDRSGLASRQSGLKKEIRAIQQENLKIAKVIKSQTAHSSAEGSSYYLDPLIQIVHMSLFIEDYSSNIQKLSSDLGISDARAATCIEALVKLDLAEIYQGKVRGKVSELHLPQDSPFFSSWIAKVRTMALNKTIVHGDPGNYNFSVFFSADDGAKNKIQKEFLNFLEVSKKIVDQSPSKKLYYMGFDFFPWI